MMDLSGKCVIASYPQPMTSAAEPHEDSIRQLFTESQDAFAAATEQTVQREAFGEFLARATENVMGVTKIAFDIADLIVRNLRLAGRADIDRLGRQLARTEDKLELLLQEIEALRAETRDGPPPAAP
jgi:hypothetical protein